MNISDFTEDYNAFISNDKFLFENDVVSFYYKWKIQYHQSSNDGVYKTDYELMLVVDDESIHPNHKDDLFGDVTCSFLVNKITKMEKYNEMAVIKIIEKITNADIDKIVKKGKYQKIKSVIDGSKFSI